MSNFEIALLVVLTVAAFGIWQIAESVKNLRSDVAEIWKRMKRLD